MQKSKRVMRTIFLYLASLFLIAGAPLTALADSAPAASAPTTSKTQTTPAPSDATYDATTGHWNTSTWQYDPSVGHYVATAPPKPTTPAPTVVTTTAPTPTSTTTANPSATTNTSNTAATTDTTNAAIANGVDSQAKTGDATVTKNTTAGNATTGNASGVATITNVVNSAVNTGGSGPATFVENITGDVYGDIMLYPAMLAAMLQQPASGTTPTSTTNSSDTNQIVNNVNLATTSGNAAVTNNTTAGNATSGTANAVASVMNIINSIVAANQSFIGTVNIYGNLNGDILVAPDFIPQLLASNAAANPTTLNNSNTTGITNNVNLTATTGTASVSGNTNAGNATTGAATTNTVILNLTGQQVIASNSILVFVNVLGTWVGMIVNAPAGATAAELGNGVTSDITSPQTLTNSTNNQITNNINLASQSGDATVSGNTNGGNATSGNATASAMILNLANSTLGLSNWFGILFINVFGTWNGSFGIDTDAGNAPAAPTATDSGSTTPPQVMQFIARAAQPLQAIVPNFSAVDSAAATDTIPADPPAVLGTSAVPVKAATKTVTTSPSSGHLPIALIIILTGFGAAGVGWWIIAAARK